VKVVQGYEGSDMTLTNVKTTTSQVETPCQALYLEGKPAEISDGVHRPTL